MSSLLDIKKKADAKAAQEEAARKQAALMASLNQHPIAKMPDEKLLKLRDLVDLESENIPRFSFFLTGFGSLLRIKFYRFYFRGVIFAALSDDVKIDDNERIEINRIASALGLSTEECDNCVNDVMSVVQTSIKSGGKNVFKTLMESSKYLRETSVFRLFVAEYVKVCATKKVDVDDLFEQLSSYVCPIAQQSLAKEDVSFLLKVFSNIKSVSNEDLQHLADWVDVNACRYLCVDKIGDVKDRLAGK